MSVVELGGYGLLIFFATVVFFLAGFAAPLNDQTAAMGITIGLVSAFAWGLGSIVGAPDDWAGWANILAALLAAMSLGFLAPAQQACSHPRGLAYEACYIRAVSRHPAP